MLLVFWMRHRLINKRRRENERTNVSTFDRFSLVILFCFVALAPWRILAVRIVGGQVSNKNNESEKKAKNDIAIAEWERAGRGVLSFRSLQFSFDELAQSLVCSEKNFQVYLCVYFQKF